MNNTNDQNLGLGIKSKLDNNALKANKQLSVEDSARIGKETSKFEELKNLIIDRKLKSRLATKDPSPWKAIANARDVKIEMGEMSELLDRRLGTKILTTPYRNGKMNKYMKQMIKKLERSRGNGKHYWGIAKKLLLRSKVMRLMALNHVMPTWYKDMSQHNVEKIMREVNEIMNKHVTEAEFWRFYVEKANGKHRPIGAPTVPWRIILHMMNNLLVWYITPRMSGNQHAYMPGRGVGTAWRQILKNKVLEEKWVMEFDIEGFFDNVSTSAALKILNQWGIPQDILSIIKIWHGGKPNRRCTAPKDVYEEEMNNKNEKSLIRHIPEWNKLPSITRDALRGDWIGKDDSVISFAQGSPMAPILSIVVLQEYMKKVGAKWTVYADDGIVYSEKPFVMIDDEKLGIKIARKKTRWIRLNGQWENSFRFLGIEYDYNKGMRINTRNSGVIELREDHKGTMLALRRLFMPELTNKDRIKVTPRLNMKIPTKRKWSAYHIAKNIGTFGSVYADKWIHYSKEEAERKFGNKRYEQYFDWDYEPRPEKGRDLIDLKHLAETGLWDWYFSIGFMDQRKKPSGVLTWRPGSMIERIIKAPRTMERTRITTQNAGALANKRMANRMVKLIKENPDNIFKSTWGTVIEDSELWIDLLEYLQEASHSSQWSVSGHLRNFFLGSKRIDAISEYRRTLMDALRMPVNVKNTYENLNFRTLMKVISALQEKLAAKEEEFSPREGNGRARAIARLSYMQDEQMKRRLMYNDYPPKEVKTREERYIFEKTKRGRKALCHILRPRAEFLWPPFSMLTDKKDRCSDDIKEIHDMLRVGPTRIRPLYKRLKAYGDKYKHITRYMKPMRKDVYVEHHLYH